MRREVQLSFSTRNLVAFFRSNNRWTWLALGLIILGIFLIPLPLYSNPPVERRIRIEASRYAYAPATIRVNPGDHVTLELISTDVVHGIYLDGYDLEVTADPGQTARLSFVADKPGSFRFRCSVTCGELHPFMIGKLAIGPNWLYWKALGAAVLVAFAGLRMVRK